jgi:hypothetical protein
MKRLIRVDRLHTDSINSAAQENLRRVPERSTPERVTTATTEFTVNHNLGRTPDSFGCNPWGDARIWATETNRSKWTDKVLVLTASAAVTATIWAEGW